jgi:hypothetical protein
MESVCMALSEAHMRVMAKPIGCAILIAASVVLASGQTGAADDRQQVTMRLAMKW